MKKILIGILVITGWQALAVSPVAVSDKQILAGLFEVFKKQDNYSYQATIISKVEGANTKADTIHMLNYQSKQDFVLYSRSEHDLFFMNKAGQFRVNKKLQTIYYVLYKNEAESAEAMKAYASPQVAQLIDSFFIGKATSITRKSEKTQVRFLLKYPEQSMIRDMSVVYSTRDSFFKSIHYTMARPSSDGRTQVIQSLLMDHYESKMPEEVRELIDRSSDLHGYLLTTYKGYTIKAI